MAIRRSWPRCCGGSATARMGWSIALFPRYAAQLERARASFRPVEIAGRKTSWRQGRHAAPRRQLSGDAGAGATHPAAVHQREPGGPAANWRLGEPFEAVAGRFGGDCGSRGRSRLELLRLTGITKSRRSAVRRADAAAARPDEGGSGVPGARAADADRFPGRARRGSRSPIR